MVCELLQKEATPERVAFEALQILQDDVLRSEMQAELRKLRMGLGSPPVAGKVAQEILSLMRGESGERL